MFWIGPDQFNQRGLSFSVSQQDAESDKITFEKMNTVLSLLEKRYVTEVDRQKLLTGAMNGMVEALDDPYTSYMNIEQSNHFQEEIDSQFEGIGTEVTTEDGKVKVVTPYKGSPAEKAGVKANDFIISVNGQSLIGLDLEQAVKKIRGPKGTQAKLLIERAGLTKPIELVVVRDKIALETVNSKLYPDQIGKIQITTFAMNTAADFLTQLEDLEKRGMKSLVIDVRNNPGGLLDSVTEILYQFVPEGEVLFQRKERNQKTIKTLSKGSKKPYPITVLINEGSASASEIMAAALKETIGAKLIGQTTFGKGSVQATYSEALKDGSMMKITTAKWLTPKGNVIHKKGVVPDEKVKQPELFDIPRLTEKQALKFDMVSDDVKGIQKILKNLGYQIGRTDGYFDKQTERAVIDFQTKNKLTPTGVADQKTMKVLGDQLVKFILDEKNDIQLKRALEISRNAALKR